MAPHLPHMMPGSSEGEGAARPRLVRAALALHPAYFALVMATGIVASALQMQGARWLAVALVPIAAVAYLVLGALTVVRLVLAPRAVLADLGDHERGVGFFTTVAATGVLGSVFLTIIPLPRLALGLWWLSVALWLAFTYSVFTALMVKEQKPPLATGIHGGWLLSVVATQAVASLGSLLLRRTNDSELLAFTALAAWLAGGMLYVWIISLIFYRYTFFTMHPSDLMPPYWVNMGAMAISTLAGASLAEAGRGHPFIAALLPFIQGATLLFWATATWWIPMLIILFLWRHAVRRHRLAYHALYWGAVFPIGMYSACTYRFSSALGLPFLRPVASVFAWAALAAWCAAFLGLLRGLFGGWLGPSASSPGGTHHRAG